MISEEKNSVGVLQREAARRLSDAGIDSARLDARVLLAHAMGVGSRDLFGREELIATPEQVTHFERMVMEREARRPVSRILGTREFWSLEFELSPDTLDPRPDSETLVETVLRERPDGDAPLRILDLGTGTGCLLLAVLSERVGWSGIGADVASGAVDTATRNAERLGLTKRARFLVSNWADAVDGSFDIIISNPPYITDAVIAGLEPEVAEHDPMRALSGGSDGLEAYREIAAILADLLVPGGLAVLEIGFDQAEEAGRILSGDGLSLRSIERDFGGNDRCLVLERDKMAQKG